MSLSRFYIYKLPHKHGSKTQNDGQKYLLMDKGSERWTDGKVLVNDSTGALGRTVGQLYQQEKVCCVLYPFPISCLSYIRAGIELWKTSVTV